MGNRFAKALRGAMQESEERTENALLNNAPEKMTTISSFTEKSVQEEKKVEVEVKEEQKPVETEVKAPVENKPAPVAEATKDENADVDEAIRADWEKYNAIYPDGTYYKGMQLNVPVEINQRYELLKARLDKPGKIKIVKKQLYLMALEEYLNNHKA